jgi:hypothetical protein
MVLVAAVAVQIIVSIFWLPAASPSRLFDAIQPATRFTAIADLAIGVAGVAAMVGGFAGVVVVFGLSSNDERFRKVRLKAATSLSRNWMSVLTTPLVAAFGSIIAAAVASAGRTDVAVWMLELFVVLAAHGAVRLVIVLFELVKVVHNSDASSQQKADTVDPDELFE